MSLAALASSLLRAPGALFMYASLDPTESTEVSNRSVLAERFCRLIIGGLLLLPVYLGARHGLMNLEQNPVLESALAGAFLIQMWTGPGRDRSEERRVGKEGR